MQSIAQESEAALKELQRTKQGYLTSLQFSGVNIKNGTYPGVFVLDKTTKAHSLIMGAIHPK